MKAFIFNFFLIFISLVLGIIVLPLLLLPKGHKALLIFAKTWARTILFILAKLCKIKAKVVGVPPRSGPFIVASKHQSAWETIFFLVLFENPVFVLKKELTKIPIYGWYLSKLGMIIINRKAGVEAIKSLKKGAKEALAAGRPIIIFPEGTRTKPGEKIPYKSGIKILAEELKLPVIPVKLDSGLYWQEKKSGIIKVEILEPFIAKKDFLRELQAIIDE
jgi:1-acyl-sn-glycerol-3-phosphate acyltransferase